MFKNFFKTAVRNLLQSKGHSLINITGLSVGMAVAILIGLWIYDEVSFDKQFANEPRIARVIQNLTNNGEVETWEDVPYPLAEELRKNYGHDFKQVVVSVTYDQIVTSRDNKLRVKTGFFEKGAAEMFILRMLRGDRNSLDNPSSILLSESTARAFFGNEDPINKTLKFDEMPPVKVAGVYQDLPRNSTFADLQLMASWDFFANNSTWLKTLKDPWQPNFTRIYVQLADHADLAQVSRDIKDAKLKRLNAHL